MQHSRPASARKRLVRHLPDACLIVALLVVLALSLERGSPGRTDWVDSARQAVSRQVGAPVQGPAVAVGAQRPVAAVAANPG